MKTRKTLCSIAIGLLSSCLVMCRAENTFDNPATYRELDIKQAYTKENVIPVAILGGGPAGLTAAMYTTRARIHTVVFTGPVPGGQLTNTTLVENWPGIAKMQGYEIMDILQKQVQDFGAVIIEDTVTKVDFDQWPFVLMTESGRVMHALTIVIATGSAPRQLGIPGELEYWGRGVTPCALCDCGFFKGKDVVVVGGGDGAVEEALQLASHAKTVTIIVRKDRMRAAKSMQERLEDYKNVSIVYNKQILEVVGDGNAVTGLKIKDFETDQESLLTAQGLFLAIGHNPNTSLFSNYLAINNAGYLELEGRSQTTSVKGVFAAGDVEDSKFRQAVVASSSGCKAGLEAVEWLRDIGLTELVARKLQLFAEETEVQIN
ncbi:thioredoxin-disulfide reductase [Candidatus Dependentiae bacterium]|nr:thioredoxin-disulfide reductase [Candidatus Dependentiae bacterium]